MRKTLLQVVIALTVLSMVLSACGPSAPEEVGGFQIPAIDKNKFNVAMVLIGPHDDGGLMSVTPITTTTLCRSRRAR